MPSDFIARITTRFADITASVLSQMTGQEVRSELSSKAIEAQTLCGVELGLRNVPAAKFLVSFPPEVFRELGASILGSPIPDDVNDPEGLQTVEEFWRQVIGRVNTDMSEQLLGNELEVLGVKSGAIQSAESIAIELMKNDGAALLLLIAASAEAVDLLTPATQKAALEAGTEPEIERAGGSNVRQENLELLLKIPLAVTLRFGGRKLALREILQLTSGAVIELDRQAEEPVDLCLDDRIIARGQVVVVDGCYGLRVTQICRPAPDYAGVGAPA